MLYPTELLAQSIRSKRQAAFAAFSRRNLLVYAFEKAVALSGQTLDACVLAYKSQGPGVKSFLLEPPIPQSGRSRGFLVDEAGGSLRPAS